MDQTRSETIVGLDRKKMYNEAECYWVPSNLLFFIYVIIFCEISINS